MATYTGATSYVRTHLRPNELSFRLRSWILLRERHTGCMVAEGVLCPRESHHDLWANASHWRKT